MDYPKLLTPHTLEPVHLPSRTLLLPKTMPTFERWTGDFMGDTYGNKPLVDIDGEPMFAELAILRIFQKDGWCGVWVDTYRGKYRTSWGDGEVDLADDKRRLLENIYDEAGSRSGCFDVFCWKGDLAVFAESKRRSKDRIRLTQLRWIEAALSMGLPKDSLLIVEWSLAG